MLGGLFFLLPLALAARDPKRGCTNYGTVTMTMEDYTSVAISETSLWNANNLQMTLECDDGLVFFATSYFYDADKSNLANAHAAARWLLSGQATDTHGTLKVTANQAPSFTPAKGTGLTLNCTSDSIA